MKKFLLWLVIGCGVLTVLGVLVSLVKPSGSGTATAESGATEQTATPVASESKHLGPFEDITAGMQVSRSDCEEMKNGGLIISRKTFFVTFTGDMDDVASASFVFDANAEDVKGPMSVLTVLLNNTCGEKAALQIVQGIGSKLSDRILQGSWTVGEKTVDMSFQEFKDTPMLFVTVKR